MTAADQSIIHLHPLVPAELPSHPTLAPHQQSSPDTAGFLKRALDEATALIDTTLPQSFRIVSKSKTSPPSAAPVELLSHSVAASDLPSHVKKEGSSSSKGETWFARRSVHEDAEKEGTASRVEFEEGLFRNHSANEMDYTPDVYDAYKVLEWDASQLGNVEGYEQVGMYIVEMCHHIPPPLSNRVFSVLVITARTPNPASTSLPAFIDVQVPVDITGLSEAMYSNGRHKTAGDTAQKKKAVTIGQYTSVERVKVTEKSEGKQEVVWEMATASDARGSLPMALQKMGVPGAVVKDVGFFLSWTAGRRKSAA
ncbi:MAG: hypothetical protein M1821_006441 [Bathelium mastoideum]|nr:MAG: hypothetical protein M1821_006441 [Bathelium mastoideum]KAI9693718.1 MAG: hypothetical protein M1822_002989 [Bathelium mastoideum]